MKPLRNITLKSLKQQKGQGMTEYIIIVALIAVSAIGVYSLFGQTIRNQTAGLTKEMSGQSGAGEISQAKANAGKAATNAEKTKNLGNYDLDNNVGGGK
ncbi:Flp family type IVb pilin [Cupriavidus malaysiensis]|uniref:Flp family type IVb pilin n=1 Tax=Cupriavidus malaysiensis TaxID=367825 RepID=UPI000AEACC12|nr:pilus assembly protein [Cupriavidus malaysiensis]